LARQTSQPGSAGGELTIKIAQKLNIEVLLLPLEDALGRAAAAVPALPARATLKAGKCIYDDIAPFPTVASSQPNLKAKRRQRADAKRFTKTP
jgi:hypothetical protein